MVMHLSCDRINVWMAEMRIGMTMMEHWTPYQWLTLVSRSSTQAVPSRMTMSVDLSSQASGELFFFFNLCNHLFLLNQDGGLWFCQEKGQWVMIMSCFYFSCDLIEVCLHVAGITRLLKQITFSTLWTGREPEFSLISCMTASLIAVGGTSSGEFQLSPIKSIGNLRPGNCST